MYMDNIKLFVKNEKKIRKLKTGSEDIQPRHRDGICYGKMCFVNNEKRKIANDRRSRTTKLRKNQNTLKKKQK